MSKGISQAEFSRILGVERSYVTQLKKAGRLVIDDEGKVMVDESIKLIEKTKDASRTADLGTNKPAKESDEDHIKNYQKARAEREKYNALQAKIKYETETGKLMVASEVIQVVTEADMEIRTKLEDMAYGLAPILAIENNEDKIKIIINNYVENTLTALSRSLGSHNNQHQ